MSHYRLVAISPGSDVTEEHKCISLNNGETVELGRHMLVNKKKNVSRKQGSVVVWGDTVLFTQHGINPCSLRKPSGMTLEMKQEQTFTLSEGDVLSLLQDQGLFTLVKDTLADEPPTLSLSLSPRPNTNQNKRKRNSNNDSDSYSHSESSADSPSPSPRADNNHEKKKKSSDSSSDLDSAKHKKKKQKIDNTSDTSQRDVSEKVASIIEIFPDIESAQVLRVLASLGNNEEKAIEYFLSDTKTTPNDDAIEKERKLQEQLKEEKKKLEAAVGLAMPGYWEDQDDNFQIFNVEKDSTEWQFAQTAVGVKVTSLQRIQNKKMWRWYTLKRQDIAENNNDFSNEKFLFHGSSISNIPVIVKEGLDTRVANLGGAIGAGIYFAEDAVTSLGYVSGATVQGDYQMLLCRVALGHVTQGQSGLRRPPKRLDKSNSLYDSVDGMLGNRKMYAIFDNHQSYPEYLIHYDPGNGNTANSYSSPFSFNASRPINSVWAPPGY